MTLEHSSVGLTNKSKFFGVDFIVYVEGAPPKNAVPGKPLQSVDIRFWRAIFSHFVPNLKVRFEPRGGKKALIDIAEKILAVSASRSVVAIDSDYDRITETNFNHPCIVYTFGYGWKMISSVQK
jgi:hypothetical protein